jgi:hypothetical protein
MPEQNLSAAKYYLIKDSCPVNPWEYFMKTGKLPLEHFEEVSKEESLLNLSKTITYGLTSEEVKAHFSRSEQVLLTVPS